MKKRIKTFIILIISLWVLLGFSMSIHDSYDFVHMLQVDGNNQENLLYEKNPYLGANFFRSNIIWIIAYIIIFKVIQKATSLRDKRTIICSAILASLFSAFQIIGENIACYASLKVLGDYWIISTLKFIGLLIGYYSISITILQKMQTINFPEENKEYWYFTANKKSFGIIALLIFICWVPYLLKEFPGIVGPDALQQINQSLGISKLTQWHPLIHTLFIKGCIMIGINVFYSLNIGIAIYTIVQMLIMAMSFSFVLWYMAKKRINIEIRLFTLLYFAFIPTFPLMSITMHKDTIFSGMMAVFMIVFIELITNTENLFRNKKRIILSIIAIIITVLFRNNAIYMLILTTPFIILYKKGYRKKVGGLLLACIIIVFGINLFVSRVYNIISENPSGRDGKTEAYSIPLQQITRVIIEHKDELSEDEEKEICQFFKYDTFYEKYQEFISDPIKRKTNDKYITNNKSKFFKLWIKLLFKYPDSYINAFLCMTSGYFDIQESRIALWTGVPENNLGIEGKTLWNSYFVNFAEKLVNTQNIPIIELIFNTAIGLWIIIYLLIFNLYKRKYQFSLVFLPIFMYMFTVLLGPLNGEYRYIFWEFTILPILIGFSINKTDNKKEEKNG